MKSRRMRWAGHLVQIDAMRNFHKILVVRPEGKRPLRRARHQWEDIIKMNIRKIGLESVDWIYLGEDRDQ
jgi:hypothetical protein